MLVKTRLIRTLTLVYLITLSITFLFVAVTVTHVLTAHQLDSYPKNSLISILWSLFLGFVLMCVVGVWLRETLISYIGKVVRFTRRYAKLGKSPFHSDDQLADLSDTVQSVAATLEERLRDVESEKEKFSAILESMTEGVLAVDSNLKVLIVNPSAERMFGINRKLASSKLLLEAIQNIKIHEMMSAALKTRKSVSREIKISQPEERVIKVTALPVQLMKGEVLGMLVMNEMTEIRRLENMRREFVANVSHELKTPLTSIAGFVETLMDDSAMSEERRKSFLKMMDDDTRRLSRLIDDVLELSKIESHEVLLRVEELDAATQVQKAVSFLSGQFQSRRIQVENQVALVPKVKIFADEDRLHQILINLLDNAIKFNREGGVVRVSVVRLEGWIRFSVEDTGVGISQDAVERIFERFFRVDKARSRNLGGTGLGLAIVKHLVEAHGGVVECHSQVGKGSLFSFTIPSILPPTQTLFIKKS